MWTYIESPDPSKPNAQSIDEIKKENEKAWLIYGIEKKINFDQFSRKINYIHI